MAQIEMNALSVITGGSFSARIFSPEMKFRTWRRLWIALAETEKELGLDITQEQIDELKAHKDDINFEVAKEREKLVRHDVMSIRIRCTVPESKRYHSPWRNLLLRW